MRWASKLALVAAPIGVLALARDASAQIQMTSPTTRYPAPMVEDGSDLKDRAGGVGAGDRRARAGPHRARARFADRSDAPGHPLRALPASGCDRRATDSA